MLIPFYHDVVNHVDRTCVPLTTFTHEGEIYDCVLMTTSLGQPIITYMLARTFDEMFSKFQKQYIELPRFIDVFMTAFRPLQEDAKYYHAVKRSLYIVTIQEAIASVSGMVATEAHECMKSDKIAECIALLTHLKSLGMDYHIPVVPLLRMLQRSQQQKQQKLTQQPSHVATCRFPERTGNRKASDMLTAYFEEINLNE